MFAGPTSDLRAPPPHPFAWLGVALVATACRPVAEPSAPRSAAPSPTALARSTSGSTAAGQPRDVDGPASATASPALPKIGVASLPSSSAASRKANRDGLAHHRLGQFDKARARFQAAIDKSRDHDMARYNLACALSKLGETEAASEHLALLLERDPQRFIPRFANDADLAPVRDSESGPKLQALVDGAKHALDQALAAGLPAMMYRASPWEPDGAGDNWRGGPADHAVGVYLHASKRFVPLAHGGDHGMLDPARRAVQLVDGTHCDGQVDLTYRMLSIERVSLDPEVSATTFDVEASAPKLSGDRSSMKGLGHCAFAERASVRSAADGATWVELEWPRVERDPMKRWFVLGADGTARVAGAEVPPSAATLDVVLEGAAIWTPPPEGHRLSSDRYRPPGADADVVLRRTHRGARWQSVLVSPDGAFAFVVSIRHELRDEDGVLRHAIVRVSLADQALTEWSEGAGTAAVSFGVDAALYVDAHGEVRRWGSAAEPAADGETLMPGLHIAPYLERPWCQLCG